MWNCGYRIGDLVQVGHHDARGGGDVRGDQEVVVELSRDVEVGEEVLLVAAVRDPQHRRVRHPEGRGYDGKRPTLASLTSSQSREKPHTTRRHYYA